MSSWTMEGGKGKNCVLFLASQYNGHLCKYTFKKAEWTTYNSSDLERSATRQDSFQVSFYM